jgi:hypothetical protein
MEELNKQQLILLALLVSFVTSIATGIVVVALLQGSPNGNPVIQTINKVIERTTSNPEKVTDQILVRDIDLVKSVVGKSTGSLVTFFEQTDGVNKEIPVSGFLVDDDGMIVTSKNIDMYVQAGNVVVKYNNIFFKVQSLAVTGEREITFLKITLPVLETDKVLVTKDFFKPLAFASKEKIVLGSSVVGFDSTGGVQVATGIISRIKNSSIADKDGVLKESGTQYLYTNFAMGTSALGGPVTLLNGTVAGIIISETSSVSTTLSSEKIQEALNTVIKTSVPAEVKK